MADEIRQVLGFDVSQALLGLGSLQSQLDASSGAIDRLGNSAQRFNRAGQRFNRSAGSVVDGNQRMSRSSAEATGAFDRLTTSTELLSRILFTQLVIRGLRRTIDAFQQATEAARELQLRIAEVSTIDVEGVLGGQEGIADASLDLSDAFGIDQVEVVRGLYQTLSNQIQGTRDQLIDFNTSASELARGGFIEQEDAINLLSGTLQAFNLNVVQTDRVASQFQKTIELGRTTAAELAGVFGTVAPLAGQLGVSLEELDAAFATLTINGIKTNNAATQLRGVFTALIKPSDDLKGALSELGFTSGEAAIATLGLDGTLQALVGQTDGSTAAIARLFPRVRGLSGALVLGSQDAERFTENIEKIRSTASSLSRERFEIVFGTDAAQVEQAQVQLENALRDIGTAFVQLQRQTLDFVGGGERLAQLLRDLAPLVVSVGSGIAAFFGGSLALSLFPATGPLGLVVAGLGAAAIALDQLGNALERSGLEELEALQERNTRELEEFRELQRDKLRAAKESDEERIAAAGEATRAIVREFNVQADALRTRERELRNDTKQTLNDIVGLKRDLVNELAGAVEDANNQIEASQDRVRDLQLDQDQREFEQEQEGLAPRQAFSNAEREANRLARQAGSALRNAINADQINEALDLFRRARSVGESASSIADRAENRQLEANAADLLEKITRKQIAAERELQRIQQDKADRAEAERKSREAELEELQTVTKTLLENFNILEDTENQSPEAVRAALQQREQAFQRLADLAVGSDDLDIADVLGLVDLRQNIQSGLDEQDFEISLRARFEELQSLPGQLQDLVQQSIAQRPELALLQEQRVAAGGAPFQNLTEAQNALGQTAARADELRTKLAEFDAVDPILQNAREEFQTLVGVIDQQLSNLPIGNEALNQQAEGLVDQLQQLGQGDFTPRQFFEFQKAFQQFKNDAAEVDPGFFGRLFPTQLFDNILPKLSTAATELRELQELQGVDNTAERSAIQAQLDQAQSVLDLAPQTAAALTAGASDLEVRGVPAASTIGTNLKTGGDALKAGAEALARVQGAQVPQPAQDSFMSGGMLFRQGGGPTNRGTDTVPVMASPGEMFINARDTRRFFSELQGINAGLSPQFRDSGGPVTNVGDINVTIQGSESTETTARKLARQVNREIRRGTITNLGG